MLRNHTAANAYLAIAKSREKTRSACDYPLKIYLWHRLQHQPLPRMSPFIDYGLSREKISVTRHLLSLIQFRFARSDI